MGSRKKSDAQMEIPEEYRDPYKALNRVYRQLEKYHGAKAKEALGRFKWDRFYGDRVKVGEPIKISCRPNSR
jgi:hypothetical protein